MGPQEHGNWKMRDMKKYFMSVVYFIVFLSIVKFVNSDEKLSVSGDTTSGQKFVLKCASDSLTAVVSFTDPQGNTAGGCGKPVGMTTSCGSSMGYNVTQDVVNNVTYLVVDNCTSAVEGSWSCQQHTTASLKVKCLQIPSEVTLHGVRAGDIQLKGKESVTIWGSTGCVYPGCTFEFQFVDKDDTSKEYSSKTIQCMNNTEETQNLNCINSAMAYDSEKLEVTKEMLNTHKPVKVKCILRVTSATSTFPYDLSNHTITGIPDVTTSTNEVTTNAIEATTSATKTTTTESSSDNVEKYIYGGVGGGVALIVVIGLVVCLILWRRKKIIKLKGTDHQREKNGVM